MEEVQSISHRVAIMDHGKILVNDRLEELLRTARERTEIRVSRWTSRAAADLRDAVEIVAATNGDAQLRLRAAPAEPDTDIGHRLSHLLECLHKQHVVVRSVETREANLEQLFLDLTGRQLRD
jgi:ABC-2 type transport system ATP-binding protein